MSVGVSENPSRPSPVWSSSRDWESLGVTHFTHVGVLLSTIQTLERNEEVSTRMKGKSGFLSLCTTVTTRLRVWLRVPVRYLRN